MSLETPSVNNEKEPFLAENPIKFNRYFLKENLVKTDAHADTLVKAYLSKK